MSSGYYGFTPGTTQFGAASYAARPAGAAAYVTYPAASVAVQAYGYNAAGVSAPVTYAAAFQASAAPRHEFSAPATPYPFTRPTVYAQPAVSAASAVVPKGTAAAAANNPNASYSGLDAVVYSYLQSKATGTSSQWLGLKRGGASAVVGNPGAPLLPNAAPPPPPPPGRGGFNRGGRGFQRGRGAAHLNHNSRNKQLEYCDVCKISCAGPQTYREHLEGQKHKKKEAQMKSGQPQAVAKTKTTYRCDLCDVTCTGQDTYQAHARGAKHLKTLKLHQSMGKPIPNNSEPTIIPPVNKRFGPRGYSGDNVDFSPFGEDGQEADSVLGFEKDVEPVGGDYIEPQKSDDGKLTSFYCKLCDCRFNDVNAKDMHLKGRRHRLQFKKKVNPDLEVDIRVNPKMRRQMDDRMRRDFARQRQSHDNWNRQMYQRPLLGPPPMNRPPPVPLMGMNNGNSLRSENLDDRFLMAKHSSIYPTDDEVNSIQRAVAGVEKALKGVSDVFAEEMSKSVDPNMSDGAVPPLSADVNCGKEDERLMKGVMRVGDLAKQLLLRGDLSVNLVILCSAKPTLALLKRVLDMMPAQFATFTEEKYDFVLMDWDSAIGVVSPDNVRLTLTFTSILLRDQPPKSSENEESCLVVNNKPDDPTDVLDRQKCLEALANLRRAKWFQARCSNLRSCVVVLRILKDLCQRDPTWSCLSLWALELLVEKVLVSANEPLAATEAFRHVFEAVAAGLFLPGGPGLLDPCEKEPTDAISGLSKQQREDITASSQHFVRLIAFHKIYVLLGMDRLSADAFSDGGVIPQIRKRPLVVDDINETETEKKVKTEEETPSAME